jgi:hypothetical protein
MFLIRGKSVALLAAVTLGAVGRELTSRAAHHAVPSPQVTHSRSSATQRPRTPRRPARAPAAAPDTPHVVVRYAALTPFARDTEPEPVVIDLRIGRITGMTVQGFRVRSEVLLPLSQLFQLVEKIGRAHV